LIGSLKIFGPEEEFPTAQNLGEGASPGVRELEPAPRKYKCEARIIGGLGQSPSGAQRQRPWSDGQGAKPP